MNSPTSSALIDLLSEKLQSIFNQLQIQTSLTESLQSQIDSLTADFDSLRLSNESKEPLNESIEPILESLSKTVGAMRLYYESMSPLIESLRSSLGSKNPISDSTSQSIGSLTPSVGAMSTADGSTSPVDESMKPAAGALNITAELKKLIIKAVKEILNRDFYFDTIPVRLAGILLAINKAEKLKVPEMMKTFSISRNTAVRDLFFLKKIGWIKFTGGKSNGYFLLSEEGKKIIKTLEA